MRVRRAGLSIVIASFVLAATGCDMTTGGGGRPSTTSAVAVIDLDAIAARLGSDKEIAASINERQAALRQQLVDLAKSYQQQLVQKRKTLPAPAVDQGVTLASYEQEAQSKLSQMKRAAAQNLTSHQEELMRQFRDQIRPAARKVANARGMSVIVTKNDSVVYDFSATVDITEEVIAELAAAPTMAAAPAPSTTPVTR